MSLPGRSPALILKSGCNMDLLALVIAPKWGAISINSEPNRNCGYKLEHQIICRWPCTPLVCLL